MNKIAYISILAVFFTLSDNALSEESSTNNSDPIGNTVKGIFNIIEKTAKDIGLTHNNESNDSQNTNIKEKPVVKDKDSDSEKARELAKEKEAAQKLAKEKEAAQKLAKEKEAAQKLAKEKEAAQKLAEEREALRKTITIQAPQ